MIILITIATAIGLAQPPSHAGKLAAPPRYSLGPFQPPTPSGGDKTSGESIGRHRPIPESAMKKGKWTKLADGQYVWRLAIHSQGAKGIRVQFRQFAAGKSNVWVHAADEKPTGPYTSTGIDETGTFWSETLSAESVIVEYGPAAKSKTLPFEIAQISHIFR